MLDPKFTPFPEIKTERLLLRRMTPKDAGVILSMRSNENVMKYIDRQRTKSLTEAKDFLAKIDASIRSNNGIMWGIVLKKKPEELIGNIGYWRLIKQHYRAEIGYMLHPDYWKKGIMKEAILAVIDFGFNNMNLHSIEANINPGNEASARILEATGFVKEAYFKEDFYFNGVFGDTIIYSRLK
ncbi:MAG: GNAT family N-acetyltransferase [Bacteroidota bacterium]|nr:GNAT family N-acetyltransferase [Bacteroidota bacterium]